MNVCKQKMWPPFSLYYRLANRWMYGTKNKKEIQSIERIRLKQDVFFSFLFFFSRPNEQILHKLFQGNFFWQKQI
jgi:hypothetical protein